MIDRAAAPGCRFAHPGYLLNTVYATGMLMDAASADAAIAFVNFLADPANAAHWKHAGFEPAN